MRHEDRAFTEQLARSARAAVAPAAAALGATLAAGGCAGGGDAGTPGAGGGTAGPLEQVREMELASGAGSGQPRIAAGPGGTVALSWLQPAGPGDGSGHELVFAELGDGGWSAPRRVAEGTDFFVNWADLPSVVPLGDGAFAAHWLERTGESPYAYGVRVVVSRDGGRSWGRSVVPHEDRSPTEHGFVSLLPAPGGGARAVWLDGRDFAASGEGTADDAGGGGSSPSSGDPVESADREGPEMALRSAVVGPDGTVRERSLLDGRVCDCCQTAAAATGRGPLVVYRDRSEREVRDVAAVRRDEDGWTAPRPVHVDGWTLEACPVNGPALAARGDTAAVAWFTAAGGRPRVRLAFTTDAGSSFGEPINVDAGDPVGRVDVVLLGGGEALVSWVGRAGEGDGARIRVRRVRIDGEAGPVGSPAPASAARAGGFPRMAVRGGRVLLAWTDPSGEGSVRVLEGTLRDR